LLLAVLCGRVLAMITLAIAGEEATYTVRPGKILALGLNYLEHIAESPSVKVQGFDKTTPEEPVVFTKTINTICASGDPIVIPAILESYRFEEPRTDYEGELALFVGKGGKNISEEKALDHVYGYTCANDVSQRNIQNGDRSGWFRGKSFDTFLPLGPVVVPAKGLADPQKLSIRTRLNGRVVQDSNTEQMIFKIPEIISFLSRNFTLEEGDLILTGTPSGVGPIAEGDSVEVEIEGIGILENPVRKE